MRHHPLLVLATGIVVALVICRPAAAESNDYYDIGGFHYPVTTESRPAQLWFDRGLAMCYGFNHEEAVRCFEKALAADPGMTMAYWGLAYAWGPNINNMLIAPHQIAQAQLAIRLATLHASDASPRERDLVAALAQRYATPVPEDRDPLNRAYADALRSVYQQHADDSLVHVLFAESLMNLQPWKHWAPDGSPGPATPEIMAVLESGLQMWPDHPGLCHLYIHTMEASPTPEKALPAANRLRVAMPGVGHLVHMPTHIDVLVGDYRRVVDSNQRAIEADAEFHVTGYGKFSLKYDVFTVFLLYLPMRRILWRVHYTHYTKHFAV